MSSNAENYLSNNYVLLGTWTFKYPAKMSYWNALETNIWQDVDNTVSSLFYPQMHIRNKEELVLSNVKYLGRIFSLSNIIIDSMRLVTLSPMRDGDLLDEGPQLILYDHLWNISLGLGYYL